VKFAGVDSRDHAQRLRGMSVYVDPAGLRRLERNEYWAHQLAGCMVVDMVGAPIGTVSRIYERPPQDLLGVYTERGERLIPMVTEIVVEVNVDDGRIVIDPPQGLLD
jgi:16S rRNA processing protein RimM